MILFFIICVVLLIFVCRKFYHLDTRDTVIAFTGGLGSGKTFLSVATAVRSFRLARFGYFLDKMLHPVKMRGVAKPQLYSNIPIYLGSGKRAGKGLYSKELTPEILLLQESIPPRSVVMIDELGSFMSQFDYKATNSTLLDEFVRLFRHYTLGGKLIVNDQCSENIVLQVRRRINLVYNLMRWRKTPLLPIKFWWVHVRHIVISEEIKTVQTEKHAEDDTQLVIGILPRMRRYDTYCYSRRYSYIDKHHDEEYCELKKDTLLKNPKIPFPDKIGSEVVKHQLNNDNNC